MATIYIDGNPYPADENKNLLEVCLSLGFDVPYFCWHPAMGSVGACRQCAVKKYQDENDTTGRIVMACMEPATDGTRISINDPEVVEFRANVIEWLMTNHPHDCPICDEGGECHLQDMTVMTKHSYRRHRYKKRTYRNQYLGPFINHEMNRCIQCYRCVRFYRDYADGKDLQSFASKNHTYFGRHKDGVLENEFSGNLVEVCPTGVFTDKTLKQHYTRKWDMTNAPSICHQCGLGCNIIAAERYGGLRRILSRYNGEVNGYFICDRGRFGYEYVNDEKRIRHTLRRGDASGELEEIDKDTALNYLKKILANQKVVGIGSPRASLESNFALQKLVGKENFYSGMPEKEHHLVTQTLEILKKGPARSPSMKDVEKADAVLVLGEDLTNTAPMLALALRQAVRQKPKEKAVKFNIPEWHDAAVRELIQEEKGPLFIATPDNTKLDDVATETYRAAPEDIARLGFAIAHQLDSKSASVNNLSTEVQSLAEQIAGILKNAKRPLIVSGTSLQNEAIQQASANIAWALSDGERRAELCLTAPEANSLGLVMLEAKNMQDAFSSIENDEANAAIILENDLYRKNDNQTVDKFFEKCKKVVVLDFIENSTTQKADIVIPVGTFAESDGTLVNNEGRAQRFYQVFIPKGEIQESWRWLKEISTSADKPEMKEWQNFSDFSQALATEITQFDGIQNLAPPPNFRIAGQKIPREPHRYSGRTAMQANVSVHEPKPPEDPDSALSFTQEGYRGTPPSSIIPFFWSPGWNSVQAINKFQIEVGGKLHGGDPGLRLIEPPQGLEKTYFKEIPEAFKVRKDEWYVIPAYHIFGSDELSVYSPALKERIPQNYLKVNSSSASKLNLKEGEEVTVPLNGSNYQLFLQISDEIPDGIALIPQGLPKFGIFDLPKWVKIMGAQK